MIASFNLANQSNLKIFRATAPATLKDMSGFRKRTISQVSWDTLQTFLGQFGPKFWAAKFSRRSFWRGLEKIII